MARRTQNKNIASRMYRHFAAVTIVSTMVMALFADGESRNAVAREAIKPTSTASASTSQRPSVLLVKHSLSRGSFSSGDEFDGSYGQPMDGSSSDFGGSLPDDVAVLPGSGMPAGFTTYGVPASEWEKLTEEQKKKLIARYRAAKKAEMEPDRAKQVDTLLAASMERSGAGSAEPE